MYYPYFRGKQFELIAIRELANTLADSGFTPIIEPVKESLSGLERTLDAVCAAGGRAIVITNPIHGDHRSDGRSIKELLEDNYRGNDAIRSGFLLRSETTLQEAIVGLGGTSTPSVLIHTGFVDAKPLAQAIESEFDESINVFVELQSSALYRRNFLSSERIIIHDGFVRMKNSAYGEIDRFSDRHILFEEMGMTGYGDFLTVGDNYSEGGGPAYAVAIHLTFINPESDDEMFVYHFISDSNDTPTDPAGKFGQALNKLMVRLDSGASYLYETSAIKEFRDLHSRGHFPGLGFIKKLSIKHHIETLAEYHENQVN
ncbi:sce7725 family protein [Arthrobacter sp. TWP1-1]|uniref:sce7725 family protein n=1 Tax=Arthrobacter sp. TWP1-1 TaxID=2804568 RepID=UPI003CF06AE4